MMVLKIQVYSLIYSFVFGLLFGWLLKINSKILFHSKKNVQVISNFLFLLDVSLLYFWGIKMINNGVLHAYFFILFSVGCFISKKILDIFYKK